MLAATLSVVPVFVVCAVELLQDNNTAKIIANKARVALSVSQIIVSCAGFRFDE